MHPAPRWIAFALVLATLPSSRAHGMIPGADDPKAYTFRDWYRGLYDFNLETLAGAYQNFGNRNASWDEHATAFLELYAKRVSYPHHNHRFAATKLPSLADCEAEARAAIDAGCDDPLVLNSFGLLLVQKDKADEGRTLLHDSIEPLLDSRYPVTRIAVNTIQTKLKLGDGDAELRNQLQQRYLTLLIQMLSEPKLSTSERIYRWNIVESDVLTWKLDRLKSFVDEIDKNGGVDPWLHDTIFGRYYIRQAWKARGAGYANTVTPDGWKEFEIDIAKANECLTRAWKLEPSIPVAPSAMIEVAIGGGAAPDETPRFWFDRAVKAQLDYDPAYHNMLWSLRPRWDGSHEEMYAFGEECAATNRYDTDVPYQFIKALDDIREDLGGSWSAYKSPRTFAKISDVLTAYADYPATPEYRAMHYSHLAGIAWQVDHFKEGREALEKIDDKFNVEGFSRAACLATRTAAGLWAFDGKQAADVLAVEKIASTSDFDAAEKAYRVLAKQIDPSDRSAAWITGRAQELNWLKKFASGDWVDLMPDQSLSGWYSSGGEWQVSDDKHLECKTTDGALLVCGAQFGQRYEYKLRVEVVSGLPENNPNAGPVVAWMGGGNYVSFSMNPFSHIYSYHFGSADPTRTHWRDAQPGVHEYVVKAWDGSIIAWMNGRQITYYKKNWPFASNSNGRIGIGTSIAGPGSIFRCDSIQIRKITVEPSDKDKPG